MFFDQVNKTETQREPTPEKIPLEHMEYAHDTNLINTAEDGEVIKLKSYKNAAESYDLEIQWKKTQILRKNIINEKIGKSADLPAPFHEVQQVKYGKILGMASELIRKEKSEP